MKLEVFNYQSHLQTKREKISSDLLNELNLKLDKKTTNPIPATARNEIRRIPSFREARYNYAPIHYENQPYSCVSNIFFINFVSASRITIA
jgi:hypothetical protein